MKRDTKRNVVPWLVLAIVATLAACSSAFPPRDTSTQNKINDLRTILNKNKARREGGSAPSGLDLSAFEQ